VGLSNYLSGQQKLESLVQQTHEPNLQAIAAGPPPPNPAELLSNKKFGELIRELKRQFDTVVVDGPPVLGLADVPLISRSVDGVIYTIEANGVKIGGIKNALDRLRLTHAHIFGALVTKFSANDGSNYGYGYGYAYTYGYGRRDDANAKS
jgi:succinoglycan biosynthesis transport protein ExoP